MTASTGRESDKFMLRLPDGMRDRIADAAKASGRSMNSEIVARLEASFGVGEQPSLAFIDPKMQTMLADLYDLLSHEQNLAAKIDAHLDRKLGKPTRG